MKSWLNIVLLVATVVGFSFAVRELYVRQDLSNRYGVLAAEVGYLNPSTEEGVQVIALNDGGRRHFRWRFCIPANQQMYWWVGQLKGMPVVGPTTFTAHARFRDSGDVGMLGWWESNGSASVRPFARSGLTQFLADRWDEVEVMQLGDNGKVVLEPGREQSLLRVSMSGQMQKDAEHLFGAEVATQHVPVVAELRIRVEVVDQALNGKGVGDDKP